MTVRFDLLLYMFAHGILFFFKSVRVTVAANIEKNYKNDNFTKFMNNVVSEIRLSSCCHMDHRNFLKSYQIPKRFIISNHASNSQ